MHKIHEPQTAREASRPAAVAGPAPHGPLPHAAAAILRLQRSHGNQFVQRMLGIGEEPSSADIHQAAARGVATPASALPFAPAIQASFGRHSIDGVKAHQGAQAVASAQAMDAKAYATGEHVVFGRAPDLRTAAHEAAHVVQQRAGVQLAGGAGRPGDAYERHADAVADLVVRGESAEPLLGGQAAAAAPAAPPAPVQRMKLVMGARAIRKAGEKDQNSRNLVDTARIVDPDKRQKFIKILESKKRDDLAEEVKAEWEQLDAGGGVAAWLLYNHPQREKRGYFAKKDGAGKGPDDDPPTIWRGQFKELEAEPDDYYTLDGRSRGSVEALTEEEYRIRTKGSKARTAQDSMNPYGRFKTAEKTTYLPDNLDETHADEVLKRLAEKDESYVPFSEFDPVEDKDHHGRYHRQIRHRGDGSILELEAVTPFGAHYAPARGERPRAQQRQDPTDQPVSVKGKVEEAKGLEPVVITKKTVESWAGVERSESQGQVMGASAADAAADAGFDRDEGLGWEWLHLIAHSMGGGKEGPQHPGNLVAGTHECNTAMLIAEGFLKDVVVKTGGWIRLFSAARMLDAERHIGDTITYDAVLYDEKDEPVDVFHWTFDCLSRVQPQVSVNRQMRYGGLSFVGVLGEKEDPLYGKPGMLKASKALMADSTVLETLQRDHDAFPEPDDFLDAAFQIGKDAEDLDQITEALTWIVKDLKADDTGGAARRFLEGVAWYHPSDAFLVELADRLAVVFEGADAIPPWALTPLFQAAELAEDTGAIGKLGALGGEAATTAREETRKSGNCLYEAVNILLGNPIEMDDTLREMATDFFTDNPTLAADAGVSADEVVDTLSTPGAWTGDAGDLAPVVLASVIGRNLRIITRDVVYDVEALEPADDTLTLYLDGNHYTVRPPFQENPKREHKKMQFTKKG